MALHANQKTPQALEMLSNAISIDPRNPLARFQKAQVLLSLDDNETALTELKQLVEMAPKEGSVYFVLGKVYKKLRALFGQWEKCAASLTHSSGSLAPVQRRPTHAHSASYGCALAASPPSSASRRPSDGGVAWQSSWSPCGRSG